MLGRILSESGMVVGDGKVFHVDLLNDIVDDFLIL